MQRIYATVTVGQNLSTNATTYSFDGVEDPEEESLVDILNALASDLWVVDGFLGTTIVSGVVQYTTLLLSQPSPELVVALGHTWRR